MASEKTYRTLAAEFRERAKATDSPRLTMIAQGFERLAALEAANEIRQVVDQEGERDD